MSKCIHVVCLPGYQPAMCELTLPNLRAYAKKIGADFNLIDKTAFKSLDFPPNYEKFQIWLAGRDYEWNINIDADTVLHPEFPDITQDADPNKFCSLYGMQADYYFNTNSIPFQRDGRNQAIADQFTLSSRLTHDMWKPLAGKLSYSEMSSLCKRDPRQVSEFNLSYNLAKYGIKFGGIPALELHYSPMVTTEKLQKPEELIRAKLEEWKNG